jgi:hypothetical protein
MRRCIVRVLEVAALCGAACAGLAVWPGSAASDDQIVLDIDNVFLQAAAKGDASTLGRLLDAEFTWTDSDGKTETKAEVLKSAPKPSVAGDSRAQSTEKIYGDVALVQAHSGRDNALRIWVRRPAGWRALVYQETRLLAAPPSVSPGSGKGCDNPCKTVAYQPKNETERQVITAYSELETSAYTHDTANFDAHVAGEFVAASSNSNKLYDKPSRMADLARSKMEGVAPTPLTSARLYVFGETVVMLSEHVPDRGKPLHITRLWTKRNGHWVEVESYQTAVQARESKQ